MDKDWCLKMDKFLTMSDFGGVGVMPLLDSIVRAFSIFFPVILFVLWLLLTGASYFTMLKTTGKKRFWDSLTAVSFIIFLASLLLAGMNTTTTTYLGGYWVGFYILMTLVSWFMLSNYK